MTAAAPRAPSTPSASVSFDDDAWPHELQPLLGPEAGALLAAVAEAAGGELGPWRATQVNHQPARSTVIQYRAAVAWPDGRRTTETFVAATGDRVPSAGAAIFDDGATRVAVWRWPPAPPAGGDVSPSPATVDTAATGDSADSPG